MPVKQAIFVAKALKKKKKKDEEKYRHTCNVSMENAHFSLIMQNQRIEFITTRYDNFKKKRFPKDLKGKLCTMFRSRMFIPDYDKSAENYASFSTCKRSEIQHYSFI